MYGEQYGEYALHTEVIVWRDKDFLSLSLNLHWASHTALSMIEFIVVPNSNPFLHHTSPNTFSCVQICIQWITVFPLANVQIMITINE